MPHSTTQTSSRPTAALTKLAPPGYAVLPRLAPPPLPDSPPNPEATQTPDAAALGPDTAHGPDAVCLVIVPQAAPPYDDTLADDAPLADHPLGMASALPPTAPAPTALAPTPLPPTALPSTLAPSTPGSGAGVPIGSASTARPARAANGPWRPPSGHWPSQFAQILAETLSGSRPASHLALWTSVRTRRRIMQLASVLATPHRPRIRRVIVTSPASGVLEMSVIAIFGTRVRALAIRMERRGGSSEASQAADESAPAAYPGSAEGWQCTAVEAA